MGGDAKGSGFLGDCPSGSKGAAQYAWLARSSGAIIGDQVSPLDLLGPGELKAGVALIAGAKHLLSDGLLRVTSEFSDKALRATYRGAIKEINRHKEILKNASPEQVNSIMEDFTKHEKRLQAAIEEMQRRGINPPE